MPGKETLSSRVARLETNMIEIEDKVKILLDSQIKTDERFRQVAQEIAERDKRMDERIGNLVSAIGELVRRMPQPEGGAR